MTVIGIIEIYDRCTGLQYAGAWEKEADALPPGITKETQYLQMRLSWEIRDQAAGEGRKHNGELRDSGCVD